MVAAVGHDIWGHLKYAENGETRDKKRMSKVREKIDTRGTEDLNEETRDQKKINEPE